MKRFTIITSSSPSESFRATDPSDSYFVRQQAEGGFARLGLHMSTDVKHPSPSLQKDVNPLASRGLSGPMEGRRPPTSLLPNSTNVAGILNTGSSLNDNDFSLPL
jgi:hypothetical protein